MEFFERRESKQTVKVAPLPPLPQAHPTKPRARHERAIRFFFDPSGRDEGQTMPQCFSRDPEKIPAIPDFLSILDC